MKATVLEVFQDKLTNEHYSVGQTIEANESRIAELARMGLVETGKAKSKPEKTEEEEAEYVAEPLKKTSKKAQSKR